MGVPKRDGLVNPLLKVLKEKGGVLSVKDQEQAVASELKLEEADIKEIHRGSRTKLQYNLAWARFLLRHLGLIDCPAWGTWQLTSLGKAKDFVTQLELRMTDQDGAQSEEIEGIDGEIGETFGSYPIDSVLIRQETRTAGEIVRRIVGERFIMPEFQRDFIWPLETQSRLIESTFLRIPLPVLYLAERDDGKMVIVDGLQRLTTFRRFLTDQFALRSLQISTELNGLKFSQLPAKLQNRVEDAQLILYLIDSKAPEQVKLDIFERVNGGVPLSRQQMRNCIYTGPATQWLKAEANDEMFLSATGHSLNRGTMRDRECINRFCAFSLLTEERYSSGDMDAFLAEALREMNKLPAADLLKLSLRFQQSMNNNQIIFGRHAFRKHKTFTEKRNVINVALFDVFSVLLADISPEFASRIATQVQQTFVALLDNPTFYDAITFGTNSSVKVKARFSIAREVIKPLLSNVE